ncbi:MAG: hypothetical protein IJI65_05025 [Lachnospiraceae bacterium]|nr:hypothetical protein [Lachnospiraceae bacterium]
MTKQAMISELRYDDTMAMARKLSDSGLVNEEEYSLFEKKMREKYKPKILVLFSKSA